MENKKFVSSISGLEFPEKEKISGSTIRHSLLNFIQKDRPNFTEKSVLSLSELNQIREDYITRYLQNEVGELTRLEHFVIDSMKDKTPVTAMLDNDDESPLSFGQRIADKVADFGGSWTFIISFLLLLVVWIFINTFILVKNRFDPYPFILLNLILSCIAALQAPVIMMSQNRQEEKDRERSKKDYVINLKSELEIRTLHEKIDHLIIHQQEQLLEIQKIQIEMMSDIQKSINEKK